jgi:hypothetical protein
MNDILQQLTTIAQDKDPQTKQKIFALRNQLSTLLSQTTPDSIDISPAGINIGHQDILSSQELLPEVKSLVLIVKEFLINRSNGNYLNIKQKDIVAQRQKCNPGIKFEYTWLDAMERIYRQAGRKVEYDSPGYTESYDANFTFEAKK